MIEELAWDTAFFGRKIGRLLPDSSREKLRGALARAREENFTYLTCRLDAADIATVRMLEAEGFYLTDFGLIFGREVERMEPHPKAARTATVEDAEAVGRLALGLFRTGRFYHDPFFTEEEAEGMYRAWAENSVKGEAADRVFLVDGEGFVTCRVSGGEGDIPLIGVVAGSRGKGTGSALMHRALAWFRERGAAGVKVRTLAGNRPAVLFYTRLGFSVRSADVTMGKILVPPR